MPLHGVGLVVGGTLAVIGSGYAFKKYVYDPHLAPFIEAFLLSHPSFALTLNPSFSSPSFEDRVHRPRHAIPIPVGVPTRTEGLSTARQVLHATRLRRRSTRLSRGKDEDLDMELRESQGLLKIQEREQFYLDGKGTQAMVRSRPMPMGLRQTQGEAQPALGLADRRKGGEGDEIFLPPRKRQASERIKESASPSAPAGRDLIDLSTGSTPAPAPAPAPAPEAIARPPISRPLSRQARETEAEIRSVIFNYPTPPASRPPTPRIRLQPEPFPSVYSAGAPLSLHVSPIRTPASPASVSSVWDGGEDLDASGMGESTTFSFLSLSRSQQSSPEVGMSMLGSWNMGESLGLGLGEAAGDREQGGTETPRSPRPVGTQPLGGQLPLRSPQMVHLRDISPPTPARSGLSGSDHSSASNILDLGTGPLRLGSSDYLDLEGVRTSTSDTPSSASGVASSFPAFEFPDFPSVPAGALGTDSGIPDIPGRQSDTGNDNAVGAGASACSGPPHTETVAQDLGLTFMRVRSLPSAAGLRSVVSLSSESEGGRSDDWEAV